ncbi:MAG: gamma-glutamyltransferase family protein [Phycisphaerales bacterium]|nr:gamma-glutamyltransferase family protein [Phycisphaerales bacterium]
MVVAASQPLAAQAGLTMLQRGGSAADAAIATAAALTVLEPTTNGLGGDAFALVWDGTSVRGLNGSGRSPRAFRREMVQEAKFPTRGWLPVTVPGQIRAWRDLHLRYGKLPFKELFLPAIDLARQGFLLAPLTAGLWKNAASTFSADPYWRNCFLPSGQAPSAGELIQLPDHARTLEVIADTGGEAFYSGELARAIVAHSTATGGVLSLDDLATHTSDWVEPLSIEYHGHKLHEIPPNGQGIAALIALGVLRHFDIASMDADCPDATHLAIEAMKLGFADAHTHVADRAAMNLEPAALLDPNRLEQLAHKIDSTHAQDFGAGIPKPGGTVYFCTADAQGMMVSFIQSNYTGWGSGIVVPTTGIALQNRGACFTLAAGHPNEAAPSKRPYHTIIPAFLTRTAPQETPQPHTDPAAAGSGKDEALMAFGVMGGFMQPQGHLQVTSRIVDHQQSPQAALDAPRWQWMRSLDIGVEPWWNSADERDPSRSLVDALCARGHAAKLAKEKSVSFGRGQAIMCLATGYAAASDLRADGQAVAL